MASAQAQASQKRASKKVFEPATPRGAAARKAVAVPGTRSTGQGCASQKLNAEARSRQWLCARSPWMGTRVFRCQVMTRRSLSLVVGGMSVQNDRNPAQLLAAAGPPSLLPGCVHDVSPYVHARSVLKNMWVRVCNPQNCSERRPRPPSRQMCGQLRASSGVIASLSKFVPGLIAGHAAVAGALPHSRQNGQRPALAAPQTFVFSFLQAAPLPLAKLGRAPTYMPRADAGHGVARRLPSYRRGRPPARQSRPLITP